MLGEFAITRLSTDEMFRIQDIENVLNEVMLNSRILVQNETSQNGAGLNGATPLPKLVAPSGEAIEIPLEVFQSAQRLIDHLAKGQSYEVVSPDYLMNEDQAARYLGATSHTFMRDLFASGELPFVERGSSRKYVRFGDLFQYEERMHQKQDEFLAEMLAFSQETDTL